MEQDKEEVVSADGKPGGTAASGDAVLHLSAATAPLPVLSGLKFCAERGRLVLVCGRVGSGKTSLAHAVLGLLRPADGTTLEVSGRVAYVPQNAFVMNATVRDNVLFGGEFDQRRYDQALRACELFADLASLPYGDTTEIGERGITISGGQRQRIALARATYAGAGLIVADDPLSAMDAHVRQE